MTDPGGGLRGLRVLVTRPARQAENFSRLVRGEGGEVFAFPTIEIVPVASTAAFESLASDTPHYALMIFVSANAVAYGVELLKARGLWPPEAELAAVGRRTAEVLVQQGCARPLVPERDFNSEALLALPALREVRGKRVLIVRGEGGRELLAEELHRRGAEVAYAEVYRREVPNQDPQPLRDALDAGAIQVGTVTSNETLRNLWEMVGTLGRDALQGLPLVVAGPRVAALARSLGFLHPPWTAADATDESMLRALKDWWRGRQ